MSKLWIFAVTAVIMTLNPSVATTENQQEKETKSVLVGKVDVHDNALGKWDFLNYDETSKNIVKIYSTHLNKSTGKIRGAAGSGVIVKCQRDERHPNNKNFYRGYILTCDHVVPKQDMIDGTLEVRFQNGDKISEDTRIVMNSSGHDIALIKCWIPITYEGLVISREPLGLKDKVRMIGYGGIPVVTKPRYFKAEVYRWNPYLIVVLEDAARGDSGGAIVNEAGELVGLISRGASAFEDKDGLTITSPLHGPASAGLVMIIEAYLNTKRLKKDLNVPHLHSK